MTRSLREDAKIQLQHDILSILRIEIDDDIEEKRILELRDRLVIYVLERYL